MKLFLLRLFLTLTILVLLYQPFVWSRILAVVLCVIFITLSRIKDYDRARDRILSLLADKIFFVSIIIVLADCKFLWVPFVAWVIGVVFIHSGVDLLQKSLHSGDSDFQFSRKINLIHMLFVLIVMTLFVWINFLPKEWMDCMIRFVSYFWFFMTVFFLLKSLTSAQFKRLMSDA